MTKVICVAQQKGGVGKTTTAVTVAHGLALNGYDVLLLDFDPQGHVAVMLGLEKSHYTHELMMKRLAWKEAVVKARDNFYIVPGNEETAFIQSDLISRSIIVSEHIPKIIEPIKCPKLDYIIIDTSPSLGGLQEGAMLAADIVIIPSASTYMSAEAIAGVFKTIHGMRGKKWKGGIWILPTFVEDTTKQSKDTNAQIQSVYGSQVVEGIHKATVLADAASEGLTIWEYDGNSRAAIEYAYLVERIKELNHA